MTKKGRKESIRTMDNCKCSLMTIESQRRLPGMDYVTVHVANNKAVTQHIVVTLIDTEKCPKRLVDERKVNVCGNCSIREIFWLGSINNFEICFSGPTEGVTAFVTVPQVICFCEQSVNP